MYNIPSLKSKTSKNFINWRGFGKGGGGGGGVIAGSRGSWGPHSTTSITQVPSQYRLSVSVVFLSQEEAVYIFSLYKVPLPF